ncbi:MAG: hypothetical protein WCX90_10030 [Thiohalomonadaceae bacterium]
MLKSEQTTNCGSCAVPHAAAVIEDFCNKCHHYHFQRNYCIALLDADGTLMPFIALDDSQQAREYVNRLTQRHISHTTIILKWDPKEGNFSAF